MTKLPVLTLSLVLLTGTGAALGQEKGGDTKPAQKKAPAKTNKTKTQPGDDRPAKSKAPSDSKTAPAK
jgi:hypothetical protein